MNSDNAGICWYINEDIKDDIEQVKFIVANKFNVDVMVEKFKANMKEQLKFIKKFSRYGFLIPLEFDTEECKYWYSCTRNKELEDILIKFFSKNKQEQLIKIKKRFDNNKELENFKKIYNQAYYNYNNKKYYSSCIVLTSLFEGLIRYYAKTFFNKQINSVSEINGELGIRYKNKYTIIFQNKNGLANFIDEFFISVNQENIKNDNYFNRNVLMHGLNFDKFRRIDVIKLFNIIDILNSLIIENYEEIEIWEK